MTDETIRRFAINRQGTDYIVGDLHGCHELLWTTLERIGFDTACDRLFSVGDLIDRGPDSLACLQLALSPWFHAVRGNHEMLAYQALYSGDWSLWVANGGDWALKQDPAELLALLNSVLERMPYAIEVALDGARVGIVHAEPPDDWRAIERDGAKLRQHMTWARRRIATGRAIPVANIDAVVVGHTILAEPTNLGNVRYIDTGAFSTRSLHLESLRDSLSKIACKT